MQYLDLDTILSVGKMLLEEARKQDFVLRSNLPFFPMHLLSPQLSSLAASALEAFVTGRRLTKEQFDAMLDNDGAEQQQFQNLEKKTGLAEIVMDVRSEAKQMFVDWRRFLLDQVAEFEHTVFLELGEDCRLRGGKVKNSGRDCDGEDEEEVDGNGGLPRFSHFYNGQECSLDRDGKDFVTRMESCSLSSSLSSSPLSLLLPLVTELLLMQACIFVGDRDTENRIGIYKNDVSNFINGYWDRCIAFSVCHELPVRTDDGYRTNSLFLVDIRIEQDGRLVAIHFFCPLREDNMVLEDCGCAFCIEDQQKQQQQQEATKEDDAATDDST